MKNTKQWIEEKVFLYNENSEESLEDMLSTTTDVIEQYINSPDSLASKGLLESCLKHNKLFLKTINKLNKNKNKPQINKF